MKSFHAIFTAIFFLMTVIPPNQFANADFDPARRLHKTAKDGAKVRITYDDSLSQVILLGRLKYGADFSRVEDLLRVFQKYQTGDNSTDFRRFVNKIEQYVSLPSSELLAEIKKFAAHFAKNTTPEQKEALENLPKSLGQIERRASSNINNFPFLDLNHMKKDVKQSRSSKRSTSLFAMADLPKGTSSIPPKEEKSDEDRRIYALSELVRRLSLKEKRIGPVVNFIWWDAVQETYESDKPAISRLLGDSPDQSAERFGRAFERNGAIANPNSTSDSIRDILGKDAAEFVDVVETLVRGPMDTLLKSVTKGQDRATIQEWHDKVWGSNPEYIFRYEDVSDLLNTPGSLYHIFRRANYDTIGWRKIIVKHFSGRLLDGKNVFDLSFDDIAELDDGLGARLGLDGLRQELRQRRIDDQMADFGDERELEKLKRSHSGLERQLKKVRLRASNTERLLRAYYTNPNILRLRDLIEKVKQKFGGSKEEIALRNELEAEYRRLLRAKNKEEHRKSLLKLDEVLRRSHNHLIANAAKPNKNKQTKEMLPHFRNLTSGVASLVKAIDPKLGAHLELVSNFALNVVSALINPNPILGLAGATAQLIGGLLGMGGGQTPTKAILDAIAQVRKDLQKMEIQLTKVIQSVDKKLTSLVTFTFNATIARLKSLEDSLKSEFREVKDLQLQTHAAIQNNAQMLTRLGKMTEEFYKDLKLENLEHFEKTIVPKSNGRFSGQARIEDPNLSESKREHAEENLSSNYTNAMTEFHKCISQELLKASNPYNYLVPVDGGTLKRVQDLRQGELHFLYKLMDGDWLLPNGEFTKTGLEFLPHLAAVYSRLGKPLWTNHDQTEEAIKQKQMANIVLWARCADDFIRTAQHDHPLYRSNWKWYVKDHEPKIRDMLQPGRIAQSALKKLIEDPEVIGSAFDEYRDQVAHLKRIVERHYESGGTTPNPQLGPAQSAKLDRPPLFMPIAVSGKTTQGDRQITACDDTNSSPRLEAVGLKGSSISIPIHDAFVAAQVIPNHVLLADKLEGAGLHFCYSNVYWVENKAKRRVSFYRGEMFDYTQHRIGSLKVHVELRFRRPSGEDDLIRSFVLTGSEKEYEKRTVHFHPTADGLPEFKSDSHLGPILEGLLNNRSTDPNFDGKESVRQATRNFFQTFNSVEDFRTSVLNPSALSNSMESIRAAALVGSTDFMNENYNFDDVVPTKTYEPGKVYVRDPRAAGDELNTSKEKFSQQIHEQLLAAKHKESIDRLWELHMPEFANRKDAESIRSAIRSELSRFYESVSFHDNEGQPLAPKAINDALAKAKEQVTERLTSMVRIGESRDVVTSKAYNVRLREIEIPKYNGSKNSMLDRMTSKRSLTTMRPLVASEDGRVFEEEYVPTSTNVYPVTFNNSESELFKSKIESLVNDVWNETALSFATDGRIPLMADTEKRLREKARKIEDKLKTHFSHPHGSTVEFARAMSGLDGMKLFIERSLEVATATQGLTKTPKSDNEIENMLMSSTGLMSTKDLVAYSQILGLPFHSKRGPSLLKILEGSIDQAEKDALMVLEGVKNNGGHPLISDVMKRGTGLWLKQNPAIMPTMLPNLGIR